MNQEAVFHTMKGGLLRCKKPPFRAQKASYHNTLGVSTLHVRKNIALTPPFVHTGSSRGILSAKSTAFSAFLL